MSLRSALVRMPIFSSIVAWAIEPMMSCFQRRQSKEIDSVKAATSAEGPLAKRPLRETGPCFFMRLFKCGRMLAGDFVGGKEVLSGGAVLLCVLRAFAVNSAAC